MAVHPQNFHQLGFPLVQRGKLWHHKCMESKNTPLNPGGQGFWKSLRYGKGMSFIIIVLAGFGFGAWLFWVTGKPAVSLWMFWASLLVYIVANVVFTMLATKIKGLLGYLLDLVYAAVISVSFVCAEEVQLEGNWHSVLRLLWIFIVAICVSAYLKIRHPEPKVIA
ncbi:hypothetical protein HMPREF0577_0421 [Mobiluncus mulieris ATCC 35243]|nr:hypothetical protein HMPREF0577_0421 [Mobiluncus mulieris ATCC 35243]